METSKYQDIKPRFQTTAQFARLTGLSIYQLKKLVKQGVLKVFRTSDAANAPMYFDTWTACEILDTLTL